jgi:hypothetical protein
MQVNELEKALLEKLLGDPSRKPARKFLQWNAINVKNRAMSGVGFLTEFDPSPELKLFEDETSLRWGEVGARLNAARIETGYLVYVDGGQITAVEGYTYGGEEWPSQVDVVEWYELKEGMELESPPR